MNQRRDEGQQVAMPRAAAERLTALADDLGYLLARHWLEACRRHQRPRATTAPADIRPRDHSGKTWTTGHRIRGKWDSFQPRSISYGASCGR